MREFGVFTKDLYAIADWLKVCGVVTVAMESTGVYWVPLFEALEERGFQVKLVDARKVKNVSGRKSDVLDCQWLQQLESYGLLQAAYRPPDEIVVLRSYVRQREMLVSTSALSQTINTHQEQKGEIYMRPLRYSINVTLDGCCDHHAIPADEELHRHAVENLNQADALLFGRVTYEMMETAFRSPKEGLPDWMEPFAWTMDAAKKYVVSSTLDRVDWNAELVRGDLEKAVQQLKQEPGKGLFVGGVKLPLALAELGLIDEYEFVVQPRLAGHGPTLFAGLSKWVDLKLISRLEFGSGAVALRYEPRR